MTAQRISILTALILCLGITGTGNVYGQEKGYTTLIDVRSKPVRGNGQHKWSSHNHGHTLRPRSRIMDAQWIVPPEISVMENGTLHLRSIAYPGRDFSVLFRAAERSRRFESGYRLRVQPDGAVLEQFERGGGWSRKMDHAPLTDSLSATTEGSLADRMDPWYRSWLPQLNDKDLRLERAGREIEVWVTLMDDWVVAHVIDSKSGETWTRLTGQDELYQTGQLGLMTFRNDGRERETLFSTFHAYPSCKGQPWKKQRARPLLASYTRSQGEEVKRVSGKMPHEEDLESLFVLDVSDIEALFCLGIKPLFLSGRIPGKYLLEPVRPHALAEAPDSLEMLLGDGDTGFPDPDKVTKLLKEYHARFPDLTRLEQIGTSNQDRPIWALAIGEGVGEKFPDRPAILLNGAHHGNEPMSMEFTLDAIDQLLSAAPDSQERQWLSDFVIWCVPVVNPDGLHQYLHRSSGMGSGRKNGRDSNHDNTFAAYEGVDINRNYPFRWGKLGERGSSRIVRSMYHRGREGGSEPETQAMMMLANRQPFVASLSYHTGTVALLTPYTITGEQNTQPDVARTVAEHLVDIMSEGKTTRKLPVRRKLYDVDGTDQDWHYFNHGTLAFLVEGGRGTPSARERDALVKRFRPLWQALLNRFSKGPAVSGHIRDPDGHSIIAEVRIAEIETFEGETWTSRCPYGRFDRFLPESGRYTVEVIVNGEIVHRQAFRTGEGATGGTHHPTLDIVLPASDVVTLSRCPVE